MEFIKPHILELVSLCTLVTAGLVCRALWKRWRQEKARASRAFKLLNEVGSAQMRLREKAGDADLLRSRLSSFLIRCFPHLPTLPIDIGPERKRITLVLKGDPVNVAIHLLSSHRLCEWKPEHPEPETGDSKPPARPCLKPMRVDPASPYRKPGRGDSTCGPANPEDEDNDN